MRNSFSVFTIFRTYSYKKVPTFAKTPRKWAVDYYVRLNYLSVYPAFPATNWWQPFYPFLPKTGVFFYPPPLSCDVVRNGALSSEISFGLMLCFSRNFSPDLRVGWANKPLGKYYYNTRVIFCTINYLSVSATSAYDIYRLRNRNWVSDRILFKLTNQIFYL